MHTARRAAHAAVTLMEVDADADILHRAAEKVMVPRFRAPADDEVLRKSAG